MSQSNILGLPNFRSVSIEELQARAAWVDFTGELWDRNGRVYCGGPDDQPQSARALSHLNRTGTPATLHAAAALELPVLVDQYELVYAYAR
jgi:hypothetical protein